MSPLEIHMLLEIYTYVRLEDTNFAQLLPLHEEVMEGFVGADLVRLKEHFSGGEIAWEITDRGKAHVDALCALPYPECQWVTPHADD